MTRVCTLIILLLLNFQTVFSSPDYSMQIANTQVENDSTILFEVYIKSNDSNFQLTSYQCALSIDNRISVTGFSYIEGTSQIKGIIPNVGLGHNDIDGETKLTFATLPGNTIITIYKLRVGKFLIKTNSIPNNQIPEIKWCFDGKISTILTGKDFKNITNVDDYGYSGNKKLSISKITASSTVAPASTDYLTDDKGYAESPVNSNWKTNQMPAYLIFDLGNKNQITQTRFSFKDFQNGRIYKYSIYTSNDTNNWNEIVSNASSSSEEWTINNFLNQYARYVKLLIISNNQNEWATLWEAQIYGPTDTNYTVTNDDKEQAFPAEYSLSQNYPNPFNPSTKISFNLVENGKVSLDVYNILGEKVSTLVEQEMTAGLHKINFNASNLASGIYIYRLNVENKFIDTKKMLLLK